MQDFIVKYASLFLANWQRALIGGIVVVSVVITLMGILKKTCIGKIANKNVRKVVLAFSSVILSFPITALYFLADSINFNHYWIGAGLDAVAVIIAYWLYENTLLRNFFHFVGKNVIVRFIKFLATSLLKSGNGDSKEDLIVFKETVAEVKKDTKKALVDSLSNFNEDDLKNL